MTLGSLIKALTRERNGLQVMTSSGWSPGKAHLYPGDKGGIAFTTSNNEPVTVLEFREICEQALDMPKPIDVDRGEYDRMGGSGLVWMANINTVSKLAIIDVIPKDGIIELTTQRI